MSTTNTQGPGTSSPWNSAGPAFAPSTNTLDRDSMPSASAEAARQKTAAVMAALKRGDGKEADRLMGENQNNQGQLVPPGPLRWIREKLGGGGGGKKKLEGKGNGEDEQSVRSEGVEREEIVLGGKK